jgi:hypothetical protein
MATIAAVDTVAMGPTKIRTTTTAQQRTNAATAAAAAGEAVGMIMGELILYRGERGPHPTEALLKKFRLCCLLRYIALPRVVYYVR